MKKVLALALSLALIATLAISGTVAYLQDTDEDVNTMTLGNVKIEQHEYERAKNDDGTLKTDTIDGKTSYVLKDFTQGKPLLPTTEIDENGNPINHGAGDWDPTTVRMSQVDSYGGMQVFQSENAQDKFVTVENKGKTDAYVRTIVAFESGTATAEEWDNLISSFYHSTWDKKEPFGPVDVNGNNYMIVEYVYKGGKLNDDSCRHENGILPAGDTSYPNLSQVYMHATATNEDMEKLDGNNNGTYDIIVLSQAVQAQGFADAKTALDTAFGAANAENANKVAEWFKNMAPTVVKNDTELAEAIAAGETDLALASGTYHMPAAAKGKTLTISGSKNSVIEVVPAHPGQGEAGGQLDYNLDGSTVTFNGVTIKTNNQTYAGYARMSGTYNNVTFENQYCLNGNSKFTNCTMNVSGDQYNTWTWGATTATFDGCTFNSDGKAILLYGTVNTKLTVKNCVFNDKGGLTDLKAAIEIGNDYDRSYELIVNNTTVNGYEINDKGINTNTTLWANKNSMGTDKLNVVVDGVDVY